MQTNGKLWFLVAILIFATAPGEASLVTVKRGLKADGTPTHQWTQLVRMSLGNEISTLGRHNFSESDKNWMRSIQLNLQQVSAEIQNASKLFASNDLENGYTLMLGKGAGKPVFACDSKIICIDLETLEKLYKNSSEPSKQGIATSLIEKEFILGLAQQMGARNKYYDDPMKAALWNLLSASLATYSTLGAEWLPYKGRVPKHSSEFLQKWSPIFIERITKKRSSSKDHLDLILTEDHENAGAIAVSIWLVQETQKDSKKISDLIQKGPEAVIYLAKKYLPQDLKPRLKKIESQL